MEENLQPKTGKLALNYGLLTGGIMVLFGIMLYIMDMHYQRSWTIAIVNYIILALGIIIAMVQFKKLNGGFLSLSQSLKAGLGVALIAALISVVYSLLLAYVIDPEMMDKSFELARQELQNSGKLTDEQIETQMEVGRKFAWIGYPVIIIFNLFIGFIISLITGAFLGKSKPKE
ncbi:DUF4199 domain-containing protein [Sinomicrobium weinanense]|uniref:DUF4199 domain-containing protein n=1 Tax=Sinomicrobium weinanense TaxID=2842200 RepID=A0A926Q3N7_9FLAO|nr:DUF4199 domain-containing protein [Sinomicrobium weinanense]MBC9795985.1 DUF4199 domain-containing protein [Sinomicrobium weinanense]MBU3122104.1 DUF4199 domain-containing protein [Sinomicrobium weinanense]